MKSTLTFAVVSLISGMSLASAQQESIEAAPANVLRRHHLTIAANPQMGYTNQTVDTIIAKMNKILQRSDFAWDVACPNVEFVRNGNGISNANIPLRATYEQFVQALRDNVPSANVVVGSLITSCGGVLAAGCAPVPGEPMAVIHDGPRSAVVWVHERGHSSGLDHVAQGKDASTAREDEWGQIMFWNPSLKSLGALTAGCAAYRNSRLSSVISAPMPAAAPTGDAPPDTAVEAAPVSFGLTEKVLKVVEGTWVEHTPVDQFDELTQEDLDSIRNHLKSGQPNYLWRQLLLIIGYRGNGEPDAELLDNDPPPLKWSGLRYGSRELKKDGSDVEEETQA